MGKLSRSGENIVVSTAIEFSKGAKMEQTVQRMEANGFIWLETIKADFRATASRIGGRVVVDELGDDKYIVRLVK